MACRSNVNLGTRLCALALVWFGLAGFALAVENDAPEVAQWLLKSDQLTDAPSLLLKLHNASDLVSTYLQDACTPATLRLLENYQVGAAPSAELVQAVMNDLNRIICQDHLFDEDLFADFVLSARTQNLLAKEPGSVDRPQLNRRLLEDAYTDEIAPAWTLACFMTDKDLLDPRTFALSLRIGKDPVSLYLRDCLRPMIRQQLMDYTGAAPLPPALISALVASLNQVIISDALYNQDRFAEVSLTKKTKLLIAQQPEGDMRATMNRLLLEDAYPKAIRRHAPSPIEVQADSLEYENEKNLMIGTGHVLVRRDNESLRGDHAVVNMQSYDVLAEGNVTFERDSDIWVGNKLRYNFKSKQGDFGGFNAFLDPFYAKADSSKQVSANEYLLENARLSTCEGDHPDAYFRAKRVWITPGHHIRAEQVVLYIKGVPVMYSPYWNQNIGDKNFMSIVPGYSSRMYAYLLTEFNYRISRKVEASSHIDLRMRRGVGVGQDVMWSASGNATELSTERNIDNKDNNFWDYGNMLQNELPKDATKAEPWAGDLITYYTHDAWPDEGETQPYKIDNDRYRLRLYHNQSFDEQNYLMSQINYLSDPKIIEQFFREEYKASPEPDNYIVLGHRAEHYTASLMVEKRLNDFYTTVDRLPELKLDFSRQKLWESPFYYQGDTEASYLQKNWEANLLTNNMQNYEAGRFNTAHMIYYPTKLVGFLNIIPRAGWQGTYYSKTAESYTNVTVVTTLGTNNQPVTTSTTNILARDAEARFRSVPQLGLETSFKAFKVWETYPGDIINNVRHIAEPYANYTLVPEPNVTSNNLYQFDDVDTLSKANEIKLGMRNKIQTQRYNKQQMKSHAVYDLVNADMWVVYRLDPLPSENQFSNICWDVRSTPFDWMELKIDGSYNQYTNQLQTINTRLSIYDGTRWKYVVEHRYDTSLPSSLLNNELTFSPFINWEYSVYARYEFDNSTMQAWGLSVQRTLECIAYKVGCEFQDNTGTGQSNDLTFWVQFWFTKFPKVRMDVGL